MATAKEQLAKSNEEYMGENVRVIVEDDEAHIIIDLKHRGQRSKSGKTVRVASTEGNKVIAGTDIVLGLNCYVKTEAKKGDGYPGY